jgi:diphthine-ammonia ligase
MNKRIGCSWSGGKDSCFALMLSVQQGYIPAVLINMMNEQGRISRSHGLPQQVLQQQADSMQVPLVSKAASWNDYEQHFVTALNSTKEIYHTSAMVFGDIDLQAHRDWEEMVCARAGLQALLPLWQQDRKKLVLDMLDAGIQTMIVSCNTTMGASFLGQWVNPGLIARLEEKGVDVCGENGEYHTVVVNCPLFTKPVQLPFSNRVLHNGYWFLQWEEPAITAAL